MKVVEYQNCKNCGAARNSDGECLYCKTGSESGVVYQFPDGSVYDYLANFFGKIEKTGARITEISTNPKMFVALRNYCRDSMYIEFSSSNLVGTLWGARIHIDREQEEAVVVKKIEREK